MLEINDPSDVLSPYGLHKFPLNKELGWKRSTPAEINLEHFDPRYYVSTRDETLIVSQEPLSTQKLVIERESFSYVGVDHGEWGGELTAKYPDGRETTLLRDNVRDLVAYQGQLFVATGLSHHSLSRGAVYWVPDIDKPQPAQLVTLLPERPELVYLDTDTGRDPWTRLILVGWYGMMALSPIAHEREYEPRLLVLVWDVFWTRWFDMPTSIVRFGDWYYLGLRHGVAVVRAKLDPRCVFSPEVSFYADASFSG